MFYIIIFIFIEMLRNLYLSTNDDKLTESFLRWLSITVQREATFVVNHPWKVSAERWAATKAINTATPLLPYILFFWKKKNFCSPLAYYSLKTLFEKVFYAWSLRTRFSLWKFHRPQRSDVSGFFGDKRGKSRRSNVCRFKNLMLSCFAARNRLFRRFGTQNTRDEVPETRSKA